MERGAPLPYRELAGLGKLALCLCSIQQSASDYFNYPSNSSSAVGLDESSKRAGGLLEEEKVTTWCLWGSIWLADLASWGLARAALRG